MYTRLFVIAISVKSVQRARARMQQTILFNEKGPVALSNDEAIDMQTNCGGNVDSVLMMQQLRGRPDL